MNGDGAKDQHARALKDSGVRKFEPYVLRHTALTNLAKHGADAHTLARIAGHNSIFITMRYVHPQADSIERAFVLAHGPVNPKQELKQARVLELSRHNQVRVGTRLGTVKKRSKISAASQRS